MAFQQSYRVVTIGQSNTGKTSIISSFMGLGLSNDITVMANLRALPVNFIKKGMEKRIKLQLMDTCGQERYQASLPGMMYRGAHAGLIVFDLTDSESLQGLGTRIEAFLQYARADAVLFLVGNKLDLLESESPSPTAERLMQEQIEKLIAQYLITAYVKTSALSGKNVDLLFEQLAGVLDSVYPVDTFQVIPVDTNQSVSLLQTLAQKTGWSCF